jgi:hypothetical protein
MEIGHIQRIGQQHNAYAEDLKNIMDYSTTIGAPSLEAISTRAGVHLLRFAGKACWFILEPEYRKVSADASWQLSLFEIDPVDSSKSTAKGGLDFDLLTTRFQLSNPNHLRGAFLTIFDFWMEG